MPRVEITCSEVYADWIRSQEETITEDISHIMGIMSTNKVHIKIDVKNKEDLWRGGGKDDSSVYIDIKVLNDMPQEQKEDIASVITETLETYYDKNPQRVRLLSEHIRVEFWENKKENIFRAGKPRFYKPKEEAK